MNVASSRVSIEAQSAMFVLLIFVASAAGFRRVPSQSAHSRWVLIRSTAARRCFCRLSSSFDR